MGLLKKIYEKVKKPSKWIEIPVHKHEESSEEESSEEKHEDRRKEEEE